VHNYEMNFVVLDRLRVQLQTANWNKMVTAFTNNICSFINNFTLWCRIPWRYCAKCLRHV